MITLVYFFMICLTTATSIGYIGHAILDKNEIMGYNMNQKILKSISLTAYDDSKLIFAPKATLKILKKDHNDRILFYTTHMQEFDYILDSNNVFIYKSNNFLSPHNLQIETTKNTLNFICSDVSSFDHSYNLLPVNENRLDYFIYFLIMKNIFLFSNHVELTKLDVREIKEKIYILMANYQVRLEFYGLENLGVLCLDIIFLQGLYNEENHRPYDIIVENFREYLLLNKVGVREKNIIDLDRGENFHETCSFSYSHNEITLMLVDIYTILSKICKSDGFYFDPSTKNFIQESSVMRFSECIIVDFDDESNFYRNFITIKVCAEADSIRTLEVNSFIDYEEGKIIIDVSNLLDIYQSNLVLVIHYILGIDSIKRVNITNLMEEIKNRRKIK